MKSKKDPQLILVIMPVGCFSFRLFETTQLTRQRKETPMYVEIKKVANQGLKAVSQLADTSRLKVQADK
jgi:hypothetical protein